jgi:membrane-associated phospholipid phosphatase
MVAIMVAAAWLDPAVDAWTGALQPYGPFLTSLRSLFMPLGKADLQVAVVLALGAAGLRRRATAALLALLLAGVAVAALKPTVGRIRPNGNGGSFPSGDVTSAAAVATPMVASTPILWPIAATAVGGVAAFRVLDRQHHLSDVAAGVMLGIVAGLLGMAGVRRLARLASYRWFALGTAAGVAVTVHGLIFDWSERFLTGLAVFLPPVVLVVVTRWAAAHWRHRFPTSLEGGRLSVSPGLRRARSPGWLSVFGGALAALVLLGSWLAPAPELRRFGVGVAGTIVAGTVLGCRLERRGRRRAVIMVLGLAAAIAIMQIVTAVGTLWAHPREALVAPAHRFDGPATAARRIEPRTMPVGSEAG